MTLGWSQGAAGWSFYTIYTNSTEVKRAAYCQSETFPYCIVSTWQAPSLLEKVERTFLERSSSKLQSLQIFRGKVFLEDPWKRSNTLFTCKNPGYTFQGAELTTQIIRTIHKRKQRHEIYETLDSLVTAAMNFVAERSRFSRRLDRYSPSVPPTLLAPFDAWSGILIMVHGRHWVPCCTRRRFDSSNLTPRASSLQHFGGFQNFKFRSLILTRSTIASSVVWHSRYMNIAICLRHVHLAHGFQYFRHGTRMGGHSFTYHMQHRPSLSLTNVAIAWNVGRKYRV